MSTSEKQMTCPNCAGDGCETCSDGAVPAWLADPEVNGEEAAATWGWRRSE